MVCHSSDPGWLILWRTWFCLTSWPAVALGHTSALSRLHSFRFNDRSLSIFLGLLMRRKREPGRLTAQTTTTELLFFSWPDAGPLLVHATSRYVLKSDETPSVPISVLYKSRTGHLCKFNGVYQKRDTTRSPFYSKFLRTALSSIEITTVTVEQLSFNNLRPYRYDPRGKMER